MQKTHSDHFLDGIRIAVRDGLITPEQVAIHYFTREGNAATVKSPKVDKDGRLSEWPEGFFDQHEENLVKLLAPKGLIMREMVLNHASLVSPDAHTCLLWLQDLAVGMSTLTRQGIVDSSLHMYRPLPEIACAPEYSLYSAMHALRKTARDEALFLLRLSAKTPLLESVDSAIRDRFLRCETTALPASDGQPLLLCAIQGWVAVSFPSASDWERDTLKVHFEELLPSGEFEPAQEEIDNLAFSTHATAIRERHLTRTRDGSPEEQWADRETVFSYLKFGRDAAKNIQEQQSLLPRILDKLHSLNEDAAAWQVTGGTMPQWSRHVTPEHPGVRHLRVFMSYMGEHRLFEWHARYSNGSNGGRIHFRVEADTRTIEVGYIGPHL